MGTCGKYLHCTWPCANTIHLEKGLNNRSGTQDTFISFNFLLIVFIFCFNSILLFYHWLQHFCWNISCHQLSHQENSLSLTHTTVQFNHYIWNFSAPRNIPTNAIQYQLNSEDHTSAIVKILYISGRITGATSGICVSVTSRVNSRKWKKKGNSYKKTNL